MNKWEVTGSNYLLESPYGNIRQDTVRLPNGKIIENYIVHEYCDWVNIVALTKDDHMIFVKQYRHGNGHFSLEIPGGAMEKYEQEAETVLRELREETGYSSDEPPIKLGTFFTNPALATNRVITFLVLGAYKQCDQQLDETEEIEIELTPFNEVSGFIERGELSQVFSVAAYYTAKEFLGRQIKF